MKNKVIHILFSCYILSTTLNAIGQPIDSIASNNLVNVWIAQSDKQEHIVKLYIQNQQTDTIMLRSSFFLDDFSRQSYILVYRCDQINMDSVNCYRQSPLNETNPTLIEYANRKLFISPKETVYIEIPIRRDYIESDIYLKMRFLLLHKDKVHIYMTESNKIHMERYKKAKE
jgi:hypothetical protein